TRFDVDRTPAPVHAWSGAAGGTVVADPSPSSWQGTSRVSGDPRPRTVGGQPVPVAPAPPRGKNPVTPTVVKAIVLGLGLQIVMVALAVGFRMEPARAVTWGIVLT